MNDEKQEKQPADMKLPELLDELIKCAQAQKSLSFPRWWEFDRDKYIARKLYLERRIDECRDEIARRVVGN